MINWTLGNEFQWNFNQNTSTFIQGNASKCVFCKMAAILSCPQYVKLLPTQPPFCIMASTIFLDHSAYGLSQWEEALLCNASSHWPSPYPEWSLILISIWPDSASGSPDAKNSTVSSIFMPREAQNLSKQLRVLQTRGDQSRDSNDYWVIGR